MNDFLAPEGSFDMSGLTNGHLAALLITVCLLLALILLTPRFSERTLRRITLWIGIYVTAAELFKFYYRFVLSGTDFYHFHSWLPLAYCSLFIYFCWMSALGRGVIRKLGDAYLSVGALLGAVAFLIFPASAIGVVPAWHYLSVHALIYHSLMIYLGYLYIRSGICRPSRATYFWYVTAFAIFLIPTLLINRAYPDGANLMILWEPIGPLPAFVHEVYAYSETLYRASAVLVHIFVPIGFHAVVYKLLHFRENH